MLREDLLRNNTHTYIYADAVVKDTGKREKGKRVFAVKYRNKLIKVVTNSADEAIKYVKKNWKQLLLAGIIAGGYITATVLENKQREQFRKGKEKWDRAEEAGESKREESRKDNRSRDQKIRDLLKSEAKLGHSIKFRNRQLVPRYTEHFYSPENTGFHLHLNTKGNTIQHIHEEGDKRHRHPSLPKYLGVTSPGYKNAVRGAALAKGVGAGIGISVGAIALANMVKKSYNKGVIGAYKRMSKGQNVGF